MAYTQLNPRHTPGARVEEISRESVHYRLWIPSGFANSYRLAQLDDYTKTARKHFPHRTALSLTLSARTSSDSMAGTWGFGLWNDPFGLSLGFGGNPFRLPTLPNAVWFFGASEENYLSFKSASRAERNEVETKRIMETKAQLESSPATENRASSTGFAANAQPSAQREIPANGFIAQTFRSPKFHPRLILAGLALPFSRKTTRRMLSHVIAEDGVALSVDPSQWHRYRLTWSPQQTAWEVDEALVFESVVSPNPPLGLVIWIDNQFAAFTPEGKIAMGVLKNDEAWLEVKDIEIRPE